MLQALRNEVIVLPIYETKSRGNIIIPEHARTYKLYHGSIMGEVVSVGPSSEFRNSIQKNDKIYWRRHEGKKFLHDGQTYMSVKDQWVMGKIQE